MTRVITVIGYLVFAIAGILIWLATQDRKRSTASIPELFHRILHHRTTRIAVICAWRWVGWHFLVSVVTQADF